MARPKKKGCIFYMVSDAVYGGVRYQGKMIYRTDQTTMNCLMLTGKARPLEHNSDGDNYTISKPKKLEILL